MTQSNVRAAFERHFNTHGTLYASAGRINLIGEHTDYNGGFVFPGAVDCGITAMIRPNGTDRVRAYAVDLDSYAEFGLREEDKPSESWARYIFGVCREIQKRGGRIGGRAVRRDLHRSAVRVRNRGVQPAAGRSGGP